VTPGPTGLSLDLEAVIDASPDAVVMVDRAGAVVALNRPAEILFGVGRRQLRGRPVEMLLPARLRQAHAAARGTFAATPTVRPMSARKGLVGLRADGTEFPVEVSLVPILGSPEGLVMAMVHDRAAGGPLEAQLVGTERDASVLDAIPDGILTTDAKGRVDFLNRSVEQLTGRSREAARGRQLGEVMPLRSELTGMAVDGSLLGCLQTGRPVEVAEAVLATEREGRILDVSAAPIRDASGAITGSVVVVRDMTQARMIARQLSHRATHDALTGLVNRVEFERRLAHALASAATEGSEHALCFLDLDRFKKVNDAWGHLAGDELLRQLSTMLRDRMRSRDTLGRLGGDEFGLLLEHCRPAKALRIAEAIRRAIDSFRFTIDGDVCRIAASIGIIPIRANSGLGRDVLRAADTACYLAKRGGGNRTHVHDPAAQLSAGAPSRTNPASNS
jgi:diguanylate cyclase (GGDEF)-like protein/PAS domain S-box-containing protein